MEALRPKLVMEFVGTLVLVMTIALTGQPLAVGLMLIALVYMGRTVSGAQYNPAVAFATALTGDLPRPHRMPYAIVQILGGLAGAAIAGILSPTTHAHPTPTVDWPRALAAEVMGTFVMVLVILFVACSPRTRGNAYFGVAIGLAVAGLATALGPISGGVFNPAVGIGMLGVATLRSEQPALLASLWLFIVGPLAGAALAVLVFRAIERSTPA